MVIIGIDLGTTNSRVAVYRDGRAEVLDNDCGSKATPSCVAFDGGERFFGESARHQAAMCPENAIYQLKRVIGRLANDKWIENNKKNWPFRIYDQGDGRAIFRIIEGEHVNVQHPEQIAGIMIAKLKEFAEKKLEEPVKGAVFTVPAFFNSHQRRAIVNAAKIAGVFDYCVINESTAAAIAYCEHNEKFDKTVLILDLGGGCLDVSVVRSSAGTYQVKSVAGNIHLGGEDFDDRLFDYFANDIEEKHKQNIRNDDCASIVLRKECKRAKEHSSSASEAQLSIARLLPGINYRTSITRVLFEPLNRE